MLRTGRWDLSDDVMWLKRPRVRIIDAICEKEGDLSAAIGSASLVVGDAEGKNLSVFKLNNCKP